MGHGGRSMRGSGPSPSLPSGAAGGQEHELNASNYDHFLIPIPASISIAVTIPHALAFGAGILR
jgi:hypothetical protein